jgi:hypothetical protein
MEARAGSRYYCLVGSDVLKASNSGWRVRRNFVHHLDKFSSGNIVSKGLGRILSKHQAHQPQPLSDLFPSYDGSSRVVGFILGMAHKGLHSTRAVLRQNGPEKVPRQHPRLIPPCVNELEASIAQSPSHHGFQGKWLQASNILRILFHHHP